MVPLLASTIQHFHNCLDNRKLRLPVRSMDFDGIQDSRHEARMYLGVVDVFVYLPCQTLCAESSFLLRVCLHMGHCVKGRDRHIGAL